VAVIKIIIREYPAALLEISSGDNRPLDLATKFKKTRGNHAEIVQVLSRCTLAYTNATEVAAWDLEATEGAPNLRDIYRIVGVPEATKHARATVLMCVLRIREHCDNADDDGDKLLKHIERLSRRGGSGGARRHRKVFNPRTAYTYYNRLADVWEHILKFAF
jgi:hypothetical protein